MGESEISHTGRMRNTSLVFPLRRDKTNGEKKIEETAVVNHVVLIIFFYSFRSPNSFLLMFFLILFVYPFIARPAFMTLSPLSPFYLFFCFVFFSLQLPTLRGADEGESAGVPAIRFAAGEGGDGRSGDAKRVTSELGQWTHRQPCARGYKKARPPATSRQSLPQLAICSSPSATGLPNLLPQE